MNYFDDENIIIEHFQAEKSSSVFFDNKTDEAIAIFEYIHDVENWKYWINSSGKSDPPPDFYSDKYKIMMDVMRVDDHSFQNEKNRIINPTNMKESKIQAELKESTILELFPNVKKVFVNAKTDLSTFEDHNYKFYNDNFVRTVKQHRSKIKQYKNNHLDHKLIFFILDESSAYFQESYENNEKEIMFKNKDLFRGEPHFHFWDEAFINSILVNDIDFVIWYTPFKLLVTDAGHLDLPKVCVFDTKCSATEIRKYNAKKMVSSER